MVAIQASGGSGLRRGKGWRGTLVWRRTEQELEREEEESSQEIVWDRHADPHQNLLSFSLSSLFVMASKTTGTWYISPRRRPAE